MTVVFVGITALFVTGAVMTYRAGGWGFTSVGLGVVAIVLGFGSIIEGLVVHIELTDDAMVVTDLTGRQRYAIGDIERIAEAKGSPPALLMKDGRRITLPSVASDLGNSVRAWLKVHHTRRAPTGRDGAA